MRSLLLSMLTLCALAFVLVVSPISAAPVTQPLNRIHVDGSTFRDAAGNQMILRGVNVSGASKVPPFRGIRGPEDFKPLPGWGFNVIRLLFTWEAYQPFRWLYNKAYLRHYLEVIRWAAKHDLYVIVDVHQDVYSRFSAGGCGEGFPKWTLPKDQKPLKPKNDESCKTWPLIGIADKEMHSAWDGFYNNTTGVRDEYMELLKRLARAVAKEPNVLGIDMLNEPWGDEKTQLVDLYQEASKVVRKEMPNSILFLSPVAVTSFGLIASTLPRIDAKNVVFAAHFYDPGFFTDTWSHANLEESAESWKEIIEEWDSPLFLGEFGTNPMLPNALGYVENIYDVMDRDLYSGAQWVYTPTWTEKLKDGWNYEDLSINDDKGQLRGTYLPRPFVERAPGTLTKMKWDRSSLTLSVAYVPNASIQNLELIVPLDYEWVEENDSNRDPICQKVKKTRLRCIIKNVLDLGETAVNLEFKFRALAHLPK